MKRPCARQGCPHSFEIGPHNQHQKYHDARCGVAARKWWRRPKARAYNRDFQIGYERPSEREGRAAITASGERAA